MAHSTVQTRTRISLPGLIASIGSSIYAALISLGEARSRVRQIEFLQSLSDEELEKRGLKRDQIVHRVFADSIWL
ncbi:MAG: hypothetical protein GJ676_08245 [Rhodobacteraceae bacterium]|nr:hypothetical protein [Paracoccaceae bacterium]